MDQISALETVPLIVIKFPVHYGIWDVHYSMHNTSPPAAILSQMNPVYTLPTYFFKDLFQYYLPPTLLASLSPSIRSSQYVPDG
jgi:hypothetical protein